MALPIQRPFGVGDGGYSPVHPPSTMSEELIIRLEASGQREVVHPRYADAVNGRERK